VDAGDNESYAHTHTPQDRYSIIIAGKRLLLPKAFIYSRRENNSALNESILNDLQIDHSDLLSQNLRFLIFQKCPVSL